MEKGLAEQVGVGGDSSQGGQCANLLLEAQLWKEKELGPGRGMGRALEPWAWRQEGRTQIPLQMVTAVRMRPARP